MTDPGGPAAGYVTIEVGGQLFGVRIEHVQDVFVVAGLTRVPLAPPEVAGLTNLRGRVLTVIDLRCRLRLPPRAEGGRTLAVGIDHDGESLGLMVDSVGDVLWLAAADREPNPVHLDPRWAALSLGVHRLAERLLVVLDVHAALDPEPAALAA